MAAILRAPSTERFPRERDQVKLDCAVQHCLVVITRQPASVRRRVAHDAKNHHSSHTTPGGAACSAPSGADSSLVEGPQNKNGREKQGYRHMSLASLARAPPSCAAAALDARRLQTLATEQHGTEATQALISDAARTRS